MLIKFLQKNGVNFPIHTSTSSLYFGKKNKNSSVDTFELQKKSVVDESEMSECANKYPSDIEYKKTILDSMGILCVDTSLLTPIAGKQEYEAIVKRLNEFPDAYLPNGTQNNTDTAISISDLENVKNKKFRINSHVHTLYSDGCLSVEELLEQAKSYADLLETSKSLDFPDIPFVICIADHNGVESSKRIIEQILENPGRYDNFRIVLGSEISTKEKSLGGKKLKMPIYPHIVTQFINPYSETVSEYFNMVLQNGKDCCHAKAFSINQLVEKFKDEDCLYTLAHPVRTPNLESNLSNMQLLMDLFKTSTGEKGFACEAYYGSYDDSLLNNEECIQFIKDYAMKIGLNKTGGLDTHGTSIFFH